MNKKIKVSRETIKMRYELAKKDFDFYKENDRHFNMYDAAKMLHITKQTFWQFITENPKHSRIPSKRACPFCGKSTYDALSAWINDGTLNHIIKFKESKNGE